MGSMLSRLVWKRKKTTYIDPVPQREDNKPDVCEQPQPPSEHLDHALTKTLHLLEQDYKDLFDSDEYISENVRINFEKKYQEAISNRPLIGQHPEIEETLKDLAHDIALHNDICVKKILEKESNYFDHILSDIDEKIMLDEEQRLAVVVDEDYCLLVAGAGSGKTTTVAAKIKYLVEKKGINPHDILVFSFTNKAVDELKDRVNTGLGIDAKITTFHKFGKEHIRKPDPKEFRVEDNPYWVISKILDELISTDKELVALIVRYLGYYLDIPDDFHNCNTIEEYHLSKAANKFNTLKGDVSRYNEEVTKSRTKNKVTLKGEQLRSIQEVQIANFLYLHKIQYEYESVYPFTLVGSNKAYTPDFLLKRGDNIVYLEHFGLDENLNNTLYSPKQLEKYRKSILDKRELHKEHDTALIETWSSYSDGSTLMQHLEEELLKNGFILESRDAIDVYNVIIENSKDKYVKRLTYFLNRFIELFKVQGFVIEDFATLKKETDDPRTLLFLDITERIFEKYESILLKEKKIDFADMINNAYLELKRMELWGEFLPYKYIIIDEFQDIAKQRFDLIKQLSKVSHAKITAVGDDWQSIYAFSGSNVSLFTGFLEMMGRGKEMKITRTYRNSQQLIDIAGSFVQKNPKQIQKQLISDKSLDDPIRVISYDSQEKKMKNLAKAITDTIGNILEEYGNESSILLLGRYNFDGKKLTDTELFEDINKKFVSVKYPDANITFMTVHGSKGLGFDNVILINLKEGKYGFPCQIEEDPIIKLVQTTDNKVEYAEERRLLYVALTRTKNRVYITVPSNAPSRFLIELKKDYGVPIPEDLNMDVPDAHDLRCPLCSFPLKYETNATFGMNLYVCSNDPELCNFMTNHKRHLFDIKKCSKCEDGYLRVIEKYGDVFYGCTNYRTERRCGEMEKIIGKGLHRLSPDGTPIRANK